MKYILIILLFLINKNCFAQKQQSYILTRKVMNVGDTVVGYTFTPIKTKDTIYIHDTIIINNLSSLKVIDYSPIKVKSVSGKFQEQITTERFIATYENLAREFEIQKEWNQKAEDIINCIESVGFVYNKNIDRFNKAIAAYMKYRRIDKLIQAAKPMEILLIDKDNKPYAKIKQ